jgi:hypothetical protein
MYLNKAGVVYLKCVNCTSVFKYFENRPTTEEEKIRYLRQDNDITNTGYHHFFKPIVLHILKSRPNSAVGLDFGTGTGPVIAKP